jgi:hypothetical protein
MKSVAEASPGARSWDFNINKYAYFAVAVVLGVGNTVVLRQYKKVQKNVQRLSDDLAKLKPPKQETSDDET